MICAAGVRYHESHPWGGGEQRADVVPAVLGTRTGALPYTLVRAVTLTDAPGTGRSADATGQVLRGNPTVAREDVARLLVDAATTGAGTGQVLVAAGR